MSLLSIIIIMDCILLCTALVCLDQGNACRITPRNVSSSHPISSNYRETKRQIAHPEQKITGREYQDCQPPTQQSDPAEQKGNTKTRIRLIFRFSRAPVSFLSAILRASTKSSL
jgi:hypothetical protein